MQSVHNFGLHDKCTSSLFHMARGDDLGPSSATRVLHENHNILIRHTELTMDLSCQRKVER